MTNTENSKSENKSRLSLRTIVGTVLVVLVIVIAALNFEKEQIDLIFFTPKLPLFIVIVLAGLIGFIAGWLTTRRGGRK